MKKNLKINNIYIDKVSYEYWMIYFSIDNTEFAEYFKFTDNLSIEIEQIDSNICCNQSVKLNEILNNYETVFSKLIEEVTAQFELNYNSIINNCHDFYREKYQIDNNKIIEYWDDKATVTNLICIEINDEFYSAYEGENQIYILKGE